MCISPSGVLFHHLFSPDLQRIVHGIEDCSSTSYINEQRARRPRRSNLEVKYLKDSTEVKCLTIMREHDLYDQFSFQTGAQLRKGSLGVQIPAPFCKRAKSTLFVVLSIFKNIVSPTWRKRCLKISRDCFRVSISIHFPHYILRLWIWKTVFEGRIFFEKF